MNQLDTATRVQIVSALVEGNSIRSISRMVDVSRNTIKQTSLELGAACSNYMSETLVNLHCERVQCDEIWSFIASESKERYAEVGRRQSTRWRCLDVGRDGRRHQTNLHLDGRQPRWRTAKIFIVISRAVWPTASS